MAMNNLRSSGSTSDSIQTGLNPRYTLDNFMVDRVMVFGGERGTEYYQQSGGGYNPFWGVWWAGARKACTSYGRWYALLQNNPRMKIFIRRSQASIRSLLSRCKNKKSDAFREKYRS